MSDVHDKSEDSTQDLISKDAYKAVSADMHKYKSRMKELEGMLEQMKADKEAEVNAKLMEKEQYHELYKKTEAKLKEVVQERESERKRFVDGHKANAVVANLGGFKKPEYIKFINLDAVDISEDGNISEASVMSEVDRIKREFPELIKATTAKPLPSDAPKSGTIPTKSVSQMTPDELYQARRAAIMRK